MSITDTLSDQPLIASPEPGAATASISDSSAADRSTGNLWRALYHFNLYRLFLSGGLLTLSLTLSANTQFGLRSPTLFLTASLGLAAASLINILIINSGKPKFRWQAIWQVTSDIVFITLLMHSSGGIKSGFGLLLLVSIAGSGVVLPGLLNLGFAAFATLCVMTEALIRMVVDERFGELQPVQLAVLGIACFATAIAMSFVSARVRRIETVAEQRAEELEMLTHANAHIIQQLDTGVVLLGENDRILLTNEKSRQLLGLQQPDSSAGPQLAQLVADWRFNKNQSFEPLSLYNEGPKVIPRILAGPNGADRGLVIMLEDEAASEIRAQETKLAAVGRLTAAISHEIRNPLSAISHASELLADGSQDKMNDSDRRLIEIIQTHSSRINNIIQSVLSLGRGTRVSAQNLELQSWTGDFVADICSTLGLPAGAIAVIGSRVNVSVNPDQLMQILTNLIENAIRHNGVDGDSQTAPAIKVFIGLSEEGNPMIEVLDHGRGVVDDKVHLLFEPFFTTDSKGTGLGLYVSRELAAANGATLNYIKSNNSGAQFRIEFLNHSINQREVTAQ